MQKIVYVNLFPFVLPKARLRHIHMSTKNLWEFDTLKIVDTLCNSLIGQEFLVAKLLTDLVEDSISCQKFVENVLSVEPFRPHIKPALAKESTLAPYLFIELLDYNW